MKGAGMARISKQQMIALQRILKTDARIGKKYGITRQAVHQLRKKYGIESRTAVNPLRNRKIAALRRSGKGIAAIAKRFDLSIPQTYRILKDTASKKKSKHR